MNISWMHRTRGFALAVGVLSALPACGNMGGGAGGSGTQAQDIDKVPEGAVDTKVERFKVPVGTAPVQGAGDAKVTIVEWSDFQCPFCSRVLPTMEALQKKYGKDLRFAFKHNPLPFHPNAMPAAKAAVAAQKQGKFWEMYELLFKNQQELNEANYEKWAKQIGLNVDQFKKDMAAPETQKAIDADMAEAAKFGARGTPSFFINGRSFSGAQPVENFSKIIDEEIKAADTAIAKGVKPAQVYAALTKAGKTEAEQPKQQPQQPPPMDQTVYKVPVEGSPMKGNKDAEVTVVIFSDFQCPFCSRVEGTLSDVEKKYGDKVRFVWKNNPLPFHEHAMPAAIAAMAANKQGKFWEMHDILFKNQQALTEADLEKYATQAGVNVAQWKKELTDEKLKKGIDADMALAAQLGARGTPSFFINGKNLRGAQPLPAFVTAIDAALKDAEAMEGKGVKKGDVYAEIMKTGKEKADQPAQAPGQKPPSDPTVYKALIGDAPVKGPKDAKVTIVEFSDFQCPFCSRVEPTVTQVMQAYPKDVRVAFKQLPLPFHNNAHKAAEAALEAKAQGGDKKFWEMHAVLFKNQQALDRPKLDEYAKQIGLDVGKFKAALDSDKWKAKVDAEMAEGNKIGARGTPTFFVNGKQFVGAQPFEAFKAKIEEELKNADALMAKNHIKADKVYDTLMKDAKEGTPPPPAAQGGGDDDKKVYKVDPGHGPAKGGPASAPVQIVQFSDFQCPFCSRVEPTVKQIESKYGSKVRITWHNYPLPFHQNAMPAAEAAMAANDQGKFWQMHEVLFKNQQALDRASLEKYAQEIGLDMGKFKSALDTHSKKAEIDEEMKYANGLGTGGMGTPTFFINGRMVSGAQPFDAFAKVIDEELAKKGAK